MPTAPAHLRTAAFLTIVLTFASTLVVGRGSAHAQEEEVSASALADEAEVEFRLGNEAYVAGDYQKALSHYFASNRLVPNRNVLFNVAKCYENLGRFVEAYRYYTSYAEGLADDSEKAAVRDAVTRIESKVGLLVLHSEPSGATIYLNRRDLGSYGQTPAVVPVKPGDYDIVLELPGYETASLDDVVVDEGEQVQRSVDLTILDGRLVLKGSPAEITVTRSDGVTQSVRLPAELRLPLGRQELLLSAPRHESQRLVVEVNQERAATVDVDLETQTGTLVVQASEINSSVYLDGKLVGFSPTVIDGVAVGEHQLVFRQEGFQPFETRVLIEPSQRLEVSAVMRSANEVAAASRRAEALRDAPASVSLISSREISAFGYTGTADALRGTRGVYYTNDFTYLLPGIRGYGPSGQFGNRTLVLLDGHAYNDSWLEASFHEFEILSDIYGLDRIELVRGPTSVLYGSGAFQGVINLASPPIGDPFQPSRVGVTALGNGEARSYAHVREQVGPVGVQLSGGVVRGQPRDYFSEALGEAADGMGDFWAYTLRANAQWSDLKLYSFFHTRDKQSPTGAYDVIFGDPRAREADTRGFVDLRWERQLVESATVLARGYLDTYQYDGTFPYEIGDGGVFHDTFQGLWGGGELRLVLAPFQGARWTLGAEGTRHFQHSALSFTDEEGTTLDLDTPFSKLAGSLMMRQDFTDRFAIWAGARYDLWLFDSLPNPEGEAEAKSISNVNPRLVVLIEPVETGTLKLIGSRGFRAPSVYELTYNDGGITQISSPGLQPESIWSGELEYTQALDEQWDAVAATYLQRIDDRIETTGAAVAEDPLQFQNIDGNLWSGGLEFELRRSFLRGWMAAGQYSFQRTREGELAALFSDGRNIPNSPAHLASIKLVVPIVLRALNLANRVVYESPRIDRVGGKTRPALIWDMAFSGEATPIDIRYAFGVRNLLDWNYDHPVGDEIADVTLRQPGRTFILDVALQF